MRHWQRTNLAPYWTDVGSLSAVQTYAFIEDATAHSVALHVVVILVSQSILLFQLLLSEVAVSLSILLLKLSDDSLECLSSAVLVESLLNNSVSLVVAVLAHLLLEVVVVHLVAVFALLVGAEFLHQFVLQSTHRLDSSVSSLEGVEQIHFLHLFHLTLYHHDVLSCSTNHQVHVGISHLLLGRVDNVFTIDACNPYLRDRALEWYV